MRPRLQVLVSVWLAIPTAAFCASNPVAAPALGRLAALDILDGGYPRAFFFRQSESFAGRKNASYETWETTFGRLMGLEGKALEEEVVGRSVNIPFFTRFKQRHPGQLVLLHFNGNARDPLWESDRFFPGHWLYHNGARIPSDVPAAQGETEITVDDPRLFKVNMGRYRDRNEDIGLCELDAQGRPDWSGSEQVVLVSVNQKGKTIRVRRGCYGTKPRAFAAGRSYAAAHVTEGPWGKSNHLLWFYNYSTACPRDGQGRSCRDVLVSHLAELFAPAGPLATLDGLEFDVLHHRCGGSGSGRGPDCDADGRSDGGFLNGLNTYGIGVVEFCRQLRGRLGDDRLILADGMGEQNQRAFGLLNGIESEGWPDLRDAAIRDWSGGLNRHGFWEQNGRPPVFNYINHKYRIPGDQPGETVRPPVPFSTDRLVFAVAAFTGAAVCYSDAPPSGPDGLLGIWDELRLGAENRLAWLGRPLGPAVRLAAAGTDLFGTTDFAQRLVGTEVHATVEQGGLKVEATDPGAAELRFRLQDIPCAGPDLVVLVTARGAPLRGYPPEVARMLHVGAAPRGAAPAANARFMTWVNARDFASSFYWADLTADRIDLEFVVEGPEPLWLGRVQAYAHPDVMYREFEHGLVLANPSHWSYVFDPAKLFPGQRFRRLPGSPAQDPQTNNGLAVGAEVTIAPKDALFLVRASEGL
ncbi:MAG: hypothetical protein MUC88_06620 [Planctomycetes bacterium]|nr:hypothetical protein [Planctomycetota bacterium]